MPLRSGQQYSDMGDGQTNVIPAVAGTMRGGANGARGYNDPADSIDTMIPTTHRMVAFGEYADDGTASAMKARDYKDATDLVAFDMAHADDPARITGDKTNALQHRMGTGGNQVPCVAVGTPWDNQRSRIMDSNGVSPILPSGADNSGNIIPSVAVPTVSPCLTQNYGKQPDNSDTNAGPMLVPINFKPNQSEQARSINIGHDLAGTLAGAGGGNGLSVAFQQNQLGEVRTGEVAGTLNQNSNASGRNTPMMNCGMQVRRLTPTECERLQGFPDGWTDGFADSTRYKMLGNAVCVNVAAWIARRLAGMTEARA